jgi:hypothetical protein
MGHVQPFQAKIVRPLWRQLEQQVANHPVHQNTLKDTLRKTLKNTLKKLSNARAKTHAKNSCEEYTGSFPPHPARLGCGSNFVVTHCLVGSTQACPRNLWITLLKMPI